jgi:hypothetical protein
MKRFQVSKCFEKIDLTNYFILLYTSPHDGKLNLNTLIKRGGGNRPYDARQPTSDAWKGAKSYRSGKTGSGR